MQDWRRLETRTMRRSCKSAAVLLACGCAVTSYALRICATTTQPVTATQSPKTMPAHPAKPAQQTAVSLKPKVKTLAKKKAASKGKNKPVPSGRRHFHVGKWQEDRWLTELSSFHYRTRRQAKRRFLAAGDSAINFLKQALHKATTPQIRGVVGRMIEQIHLRKLLGATFITIHMKNAPPQRVANAISQQMHAHFSYWPPQMWSQQQWTPINFNAAHEPFWVVMQRFQKKTGVGLTSWGNNPGVMLQQIGQGPTPPTFFHGAFMVEATQIQRTSSVQLTGNPAKQQAPQRTFALQLTVFCEPKMCMVQGGSVVLTKAQTTTGKSLVDNSGPNQNFFYGNNGACEWSTQANLAYIKNAGKYIKQLRGHWTCLVATHVITWNVHNILKLKGGSQKRVLGGTTVTVQNVKSIGKGQWSVTVVLTNPAGNRQLSFAGSNMQQTLINEQSNFLNSSVSLVDAKGNVIGASGTSSTGSTTSQTATFTFNNNMNNMANGGPIPPGGPAAAAAPATFTLKLPVQFRTVRLPIRFQNLRLP